VSNATLYFFDIKDGHSFMDFRGMKFKNDEDAIAREQIYAIQISLDMPPGRSGALYRRAEW
jgi:hypothetical protein